MPPRNGLTVKEERAVHEYIKNGFTNMTDACRIAGYNAPNVQATQVFSRPRVKKEIDKRRKRMAKKFEIGEERVLRGILALAEANPTKITKKLEDNDWDLSCLSEEETYVIQKLKTREGDDRDGFIRVMEREVSSESRLAAWDKLMRFMGMYDDKVTVKGELSLVERIQAGRKRAGLENAGDDDQEDEYGEDAE